MLDLYHDTVDFFSRPEVILGLYYTGVIITYIVVTETVNSALDRSNDKKQN